MGLLSFALATALSLVFGTGQWLMATHYDHPRIRAGKGYRKWGPIPITHHIPEALTFLFAGWVISLTLDFERSLFSSAPPVDWMVWFFAAAFVVLSYLKAPDWKRQFNLPGDEPKWHVWLVLVVLAASLLIGFYLPWAQF